MGVVKVDEGGAEVLNDLDCVLETANNLKLSLNGLDLLVNNLLLVLGKGDGHAGEVVVDGLEESADGVVALVVQLLPLLQVGEGILEVVQQEQQHHQRTLQGHQRQLHPLGQCSEIC